MPRPRKSKPLSDTELLILNTAAGRRNHLALPWPKSLKADAPARDAAVFGLIKRDLLVETAAPRKSLMWRTDADGNSLTLKITDGGLAALEPNETATPTTSGPTARSGSKSATLLDLLHSKRGATIAELMEATGWQAHSVRGFLAGALKKRHGLTVTSERPEGEARRYRVG